MGIYHGLHYGDDFDMKGLGNQLAPAGREKLACECRARHQSAAPALVGLNRLQRAARYRGGASRRRGLPARRGPRAAAAMNIRVYSILCKTLQL